jgi:hypothetical protein
LLDEAFDTADEVADRLIGGPTPPAYQARPGLMTAAELSFFKVLRAVVNGRSEIFAQVSLGALLQVREGLDASTWAAARNRMNCRYVDFVLCDLTKGSKPILVVELDDSSHARPDRQERDAFVDRACEAVHIPVLRVPVAREYSAQRLEEAIRQKVRPAGAAPALTARA